MVMADAASNTTKMFFGALAFVGLVGVTVLLSPKQTPPEPTTPAQEYPGEWQDQPHTGLISTMAQHSVLGCGDMAWRESALNKGQYMVYCTRDQKHWTAYLVWPTVSKVSGPLAAPPDIEPPTR